MGSSVRGYKKYTNASTQYILNVQLRDNTNISQYQSRIYVAHQRNDEFPYIPNIKRRTTRSHGS